MDDFDSMWDTDMGVDVSNLNSDATLNNHVKRATNTKKDLWSIEDTNKTDLENDKDWEEMTNESRWHKIATTMEHNLKALYKQENDYLEYTTNELENKLNTPGIDKKKVLALTDKLAQIQQEYFKLADETQATIDFINFIKGRLSGFIPDPTTEEEAEIFTYYEEHPEEVRKKLDSGKYKYKSTTLL